MRVVANSEFDRLVSGLPKLLETLKAKPLLTRVNLGEIPDRGVYIFYHKGKPIYVGRSNRLKARIQEHGRQSSGHNSAALAFRMTKEILGRKTKIHSFVTRKDLETAPGFSQIFHAQRLVVTNMKVRVIEVSNPIQQALFEMYVHLALETKYNDFDNH